MPFFRWTTQEQLDSTAFGDQMKKIAWNWDIKAGILHIPSLRLTLMADSYEEALALVKKFFEGTAN